MSVLPYFFFAVLASAAAEGQGERHAIVVLFGAARGNVTFVESGKQVHISGIVENLTPGKHGFHVHEKGDVSMGCASTLGHYNPYKMQHGAPTDKNRHVGDLGNIEADSRGIASFQMTDNLIKLSGPTSIIGRAVVVHSDPDDLGKGGHPDSLTTGHAGSRIACGVIGTLELSSGNGSWMLTASFFSVVSTLLVALLK